MEGSKYRYYSDDQLEIVSIDSKLSEEEKIVRRYLMNYIIDKGQGFNINNSSEIAQHMGLEKEEAEELLGNLNQKNIAVTDEEGNINYIYPVSAMPTNHKVHLADGREFTAMCAIDAMGAAFTFKQDVDVVSKCSHCDSDIKVSIRDGKLHNYEPADLHILHVDLNKNLNWSGSC